MNIVHTYHLKDISRIDMVCCDERRAFELSKLFWFIYSNRQRQNHPSIILWSIFQRFKLKTFAMTVFSSFCLLVTMWMCVFCVFQNLKKPFGWLAMKLHLKMFVNVFTGIRFCRYKANFFNSDQRMYWAEDTKIHLPQTNAIQLADCQLDCLRQLNTFSVPIQNWA